MNPMKTCMLVAAACVAVCLAAGQGLADDAAPVVLRVGHVGHDHHTALYLAVDNAAIPGAAGGIILKQVEARKRYELYDDSGKVADVEIVLVGGGSKMPTALAQNVIDIGLGGVAPVLAMADKGAPVKIIAPLHAKGDMFVLRKSFSASTWEEFLAFVKSSDTPVRIGYKDPIAVAKVIFEEALRNEGVMFTGDLGDATAAVQMINVKGGGNLNTSLAAGAIDGYVGNNPFPAIGEEQHILKVVADLEDLPPGRFREHPCCCVAANTESIKDKEEAVIDILVLLLEATDMINGDRDAAVKSASTWLGTSESVEVRSMATSGYSMDASEEWHEAMSVWFDTMNSIGLFSEQLSGLSESEARPIAYDLSYLQKAKRRLQIK